MTFSNQSIKAPCPGKPHICIRNGLWRVSPFVKGQWKQWKKAHALANRLNMPRLLNWMYY